MHSGLRSLSALPLLCTLPLFSTAQTATGEVELFAEVIEAMEADVERGTYHGVVALVDAGGEHLLGLTAGMQDRESETPMSMDTIFQIYSMSKPITAVATLILHDEGKLALDDPVEKYLPAFEGVTVGIERAATERKMLVRDLLRHTSGLTYGIFASSPVDRLLLQADVFDDSQTLEAFVEKLGELPLKYQPGTRFEYGLSTDVLGRLVEVVSGKPFDVFLEERLFTPLGMVDTGFFVPESKAERVAEMNARRGLALRRMDAGERTDPLTDPVWKSGGGGLFSTAGDYLRFCRMLLNGGTLDGKRILKPETVREMTSDQLARMGRSATLAGSSFGLGVAITERRTNRGPHPGSYWWGGLAGTGFWIDPEEGLIGIFMIQNMSEMLHSSVFRRRVYRALGR